MAILVSGGAGYIGSHTCIELLESGHEVVVIDNLCNSNPKSLQRVEQLTGKKVKFYEGDVRDEALLILDEIVGLCREKNIRIVFCTIPWQGTNVYAQALKDLAEYYGCEYVNLYDHLEEMGLEMCGAHGTTAALAMLNDAVKKGGVMASSNVGGLSGAFIPVSEDRGMIDAVACGCLTMEKLEAMTAVCSVGLDMIAVPGDTSASTIAAIIADEAAIGMVNSKTTAVRIIPAPGKTVGDEVEFGGLFGRAPIMRVSPYSAEAFIARGGRIPAPMQSLKN